MDEAFWALTGFSIVQMLLIALCLLPPRFWRGAPPAMHRPLKA